MCRATAPCSSILFLTWLAQKKILQWSSNDFKTYMRLAENADIKNVEAGINALMATRMENIPAVKTSIGLQRYSDRYLKGVFVNGKPVSGRIEYVRIFRGIAVFILLMACLNFMNLATARSVKRAKEVGLRKVVGSSRGQLIAQFYGESLLFSFLAVMLSMILVLTFLPFFNYFTGKNIDLPFLSFSFWFSLAAITLITALIAGSYPALYPSSFKPVLVLKGLLRFTPRGSILPQGTHRFPVYFIYRFTHCNYCHYQLTGRNKKPIRYSRKH
jgi:putative ABC transport system permease protein